MSEACSIKSVQMAPDKIEWDIGCTNMYDMSVDVRYDIHLYFYGMGSPRLINLLQRVNH